MTVHYCPEVLVDVKKTVFIGINLDFSGLSQGEKIVRHAGA